MTDIRVEIPQSDVRVLVLSRPEKRNALSRRLIADLTSFVRVAQSEGVRAIVLAGSGGAFSAGADFSDLKGDASDMEFDTDMAALTSLIEQSPIVFFAAIDGACIGAGFDLAMACDFRVAGSDAVFALPPVKMGILYNPERLARHLHCIEHGAARRLLLLAERLNSDEAYKAGIVTHPAVQTANVTTVETAIMLARQAAALPGKAQAVAKAFTNALLGSDFDPRAWQEVRIELLSNEDRRDALRKARKPRK